MFNYPLVSFHFQVEWGGSRISFSEVSGLEIVQDVIEYRDGASREYHTQKIPGLRRFGNIVLSRGSYKGDNEFFEWLNSISLSESERRDITIKLLNDVHEPIISWRIRNAWPVSLKFSALNAMKSDLLIERLELAHEGLSVQKV